eukprot:gene691-1321_t
MTTYFMTYFGKVIGINTNLVWCKVQIARMNGSGNLAEEVGFMYTIPSQVSPFHVPIYHAQEMNGTQVDFDSVYDEGLPVKTTSSTEYLTTYDLKNVNDSTNGDNSSPIPPLRDPLLETSKLKISSSLNSRPKVNECFVDENYSDDKVLHKTKEKEDTSATEPVLALGFSPTQNNIDSNANAQVIVVVDDDIIDDNDVVVRDEGLVSLSLSPKKNITHSLRLGFSPTQQHNPPSSNTPPPSPPLLNHGNYGNDTEGRHIHHHLAPTTPPPSHPTSLSYRDDNNITTDSNNMNVDLGFNLEEINNDKDGNFNFNANNNSNHDSDVVCKHVDVDVYADSKEDVVPFTVMEDKKPPSLPPLPPPLVQSLVHPLPVIHVHELRRSLGGRFQDALLQQEQDESTANNGNGNGNGNNFVEELGSNVAICGSIMSSCTSSLPIPSTDSNPLPLPSSSLIMYDVTNIDKDMDRGIDTKTRMGNGVSGVSSVIGSGDGGGTRLQEAMDSVKEGVEYKNNNNNNNMTLANSSNSSIINTKDGVVESPGHEDKDGDGRTVDSVKGKTTTVTITTTTNASISSITKAVPQTLAQETVPTPFPVPSSTLSSLTLPIQLPLPLQDGVDDQLSFLAKEQVLKLWEERLRAKEMELQQREQLQQQQLQQQHVSSSTSTTSHTTTSPHIDIVPVSVSRIEKSPVSVSVSTGVATGKTTDVTVTTPRIWKSLGSSKLNQEELNGNWNMQRALLSSSVLSSGGSHHSSNHSVCSRNSNSNVPSKFIRKVVRKSPMKDKAGSSTSSPSSMLSLALEKRIQSNAHDVFNFELGDDDDDGSGSGSDKGHKLSMEGISRTKPGTTVKTIDKKASTVKPTIPISATAAAAAVIERSAPKNKNNSNSSNNNNNNNNNNPGNDQIPSSSSSSTSFPVDIPSDALLLLQTNSTSVRWADVWKLLEARGWFWQRGKGLVDFFYIRPGRDVQKGKMGEDYFIEPDNVMAYLKKQIKDGGVNDVGNGSGGVVAIPSGCKHSPKDNRADNVCSGTLVAELSNASHSNINSNIDDDKTQELLLKNNNNSNSMNINNNPKSSNTPINSNKTEFLLAPVSEVEKPWWTLLDSLSWSGIWAQLQREGWTWDFGTGLVSSWFIMPGFTKSTATAGVHMFGSEDDRLAVKPLLSSSSSSPYMDYEHSPSTPTDIIHSRLDVNKQQQQLLQLPSAGTGTGIEVGRDSTTRKKKRGSKSVDSGMKSMEPPSVAIKNQGTSSSNSSKAKTPKKTVYKASTPGPNPGPQTGGGGEGVDTGTESYSKKARLDNYSHGTVRGADKWNVDVDVDEAYRGDRSAYDKKRYRDNGDNNDDFDEDVVDDGDDDGEALGELDESALFGSPPRKQYPRQGNSPVPAWRKDPLAVDVATQPQSAGKSGYELHLVRQCSTKEKETKTEKDDAKTSATRTSSKRTPQRHEQRHEQTHRQVHTGSPTRDMTRDRDRGSSRSVLTMKTTRLFSGLRFVVTGISDDSILIELERLLTRHGGLVSEDILTLVLHPSPNHDNGVVVPVLAIGHPRGFRKPNYLLSLATGTPLVHFSWIYRCLTATPEPTLLPIESFTLPSGITMLKPFYIFCPSIPFGGVFASVRVLNLAGEVWGKAMKAAGAILCDATDSLMSKLAMLVGGGTGGSSSSDGKNSSAGARADAGVYKRPIFPSLLLPDIVVVDSLQYSEDMLSDKYLAIVNICLNRSNNNNNNINGDRSLSSSSSSSSLVPAVTPPPGPLLVSCDWVAQCIASGEQLETNGVEPFSLPTDKIRRPTVLKNAKGERFGINDIVLCRKEAQTQRLADADSSTVVTVTAADIRDMTLGRIIQFSRKQMNGKILVKIRPLLRVSPSSQEVFPARDDIILAAEQLTCKAVLLTKPSYYELEYTKGDPLIFFASSEWEKEERMKSIYTSINSRDNDNIPYVIQRSQEL